MPQLLTLLEDMEAQKEDQRNKEEQEDQEANLTLMVKRNKKWLKNLNLKFK